ncbi:MAG: LytTR family transcriptional regulator [Hyphomonadaceae bacterium]|nr:LytTR family transcriptional regulator [Hyphomonadaceae bacterium]
MSPRFLFASDPADRRADRRSYLIAAGIVMLSLIVRGLSVSDEMENSIRSYSAIEPWIWETASHFATLVALPIIPLALTRAPLTASTWKWALPAHGLAFLAFSVTHILLMVGLRKLAYFAVMDGPYIFGLADLSTWLYELRIDLFSYVLISLGFSANRLLEQARLETEAARTEASTGGRLMLKCGGRTLFIDPGEVLRVQAAGNYVEVITAGKPQLARMTLSEMEGLLSASSQRHARVHRSHIVNLDAVREARPAGDGGLELFLSNGDVVPTSRNYRGAVDPLVAG